MHSQSPVDTVHNAQVFHNKLLNFISYLKCYIKLDHEYYFPSYFNVSNTKSI